MVGTTERAPVQTVRGRDAGLTVLGQHLDQLLSGLGPVVLVKGGPGMGKSRLFGERAGMARRLSVRVGDGVADAGDGVAGAGDTVVQLSGVDGSPLRGTFPDPWRVRARPRSAAVRWTRPVSHRSRQTSWGRRCPRPCTG